MIEISVTSEEIKNRALSPAHREEAVQAIEQEGFVVLNDVVALSHLDVLHERMLEDVQLLLKRPDAPFNWNTGNVQQDPPPFPPYLFQDVLLNDMVLDVTTALLGTPVKNTMYSGNTAMPSEHRQPVHADSGHLWPRLEVAHPPVQLVVNIPTVDVSAENGSTEIWPGTHRDITITSDKDIKIPPDVLTRRRAEIPPIQPAFRRGSVLIRDVRLWHAGMPNHTAYPRPMIAMIHVSPWLETGTPLTFPLESREFFEHPRLRTCARFVEGPIDHISAPHSYEYVMP
jgi:hypothetical protein